MTINERIMLLMKNSGMKASSISKLAHIDKASFTRWKNNSYKPSIESIIVLSQFFHVSCDYLLTGKDDTKDDIKILKYYNRLDDEHKDLIKYEMIEFYQSEFCNKKEATLSGIMVM